MKTLVVLSALACVAIAAPALPEEGFQTLDIPADIQPINLDTEIAGPAISARSHLGLKSPIIVKKKTGYHLYRDSTEERANADPRENCSKHLRVKLCDEIAAKSADLKRSAKIEDIDSHKDDVEDSIKIAKEAIESLQHDLKNIEHGSSGKHAQWKHGESDKNMHEDLEVAKHALEHAQNKIGNLESMSLRATTLRDTEALNNMDMTTAEKERMAQWKKAMENIQRNVEIARNIEDSFRAGSSFSHAEAIDTTKLMRSNDPENKSDLHKSSSTVTTSSRKSENTNQKTMEKKTEHHMTSGHSMHENVAHDMNLAASEVHMKHEHFNQDAHNNKAAQGQLAEVSLNVQSQPRDVKHRDNMEFIHKRPVGMDLLEASRHGVKMEQPHATSMSLKTDSGRHNKGSVFRTSESQVLATNKDESSHISKSDATDNLHSLKLDTMQQAKSVAKEWETNSADKHLKQEKSAWAETENKETMMKAAEYKSFALNTDFKKDNSQSSKHNVETKLTMKAAEHLSEPIKHLVDDADSLVKKSGIAIHTDMKLADNTELASDINLNTPLNLNLDHGANLNIEQPKLEKSAEVSEDLHLDQLRHAHELSHAHALAHAHGHTYLHGHGHGLGHLHTAGPLLHGHPLKHDLIGGHGHLKIHGHHGGLYHGKSAEFDSAMHPSMQMNMREFDEKSALENSMLQWKHHDTARSYGAGLGGAGLSYGGSGGLGLYGGSGGSAVGVFPNAKVGGCGIPLLLSCSPSVVSGSLAKSHGYTAPSYRHEEDLKFKNKRDIIKTNDVSAAKIRHSTKILEKKL